MRGNICVYMIDGERPYASSELPQFFGRALAAAECPRVWRGRTAIVPLSAFQKERKDPYKGPFKLYFMKLLFLTYKL